MVTIRRRINAKGGGVPTAPAPVAAPPPPTVDNSEEVKKQRLIEEQRAKREKGLAATQLTEESEGISLLEENIDKPKAKKADTILGGSK